MAKRTKAAQPAGPTAAQIEDAVSAIIANVGPEASAREYVANIQYQIDVNRFEGPTAGRLAAALGLDWVTLRAQAAKEYKAADGEVW